MKDTVGSYPFSFLSISASETAHSIKLITVYAVFIVVTSGLEILATISLFGQILLLFEDDFL